MITVQLLGGASLRDSDGPVTGPPAQRHRIALLALVVAAWPKPLARDRAMLLLWPERDATSARRLLNLAVHVLRGALGEAAIVSSGDGLVWNPIAGRCDLHDLLIALDKRDADGIVRLHGGPLLDAFHLAGSSEFEHWLDERRRDIEHAYADALRRLAERQESAGDVHALVATCRRLVAADPYSATYAQSLMQALDAAGDRAGALQHAAEHARRVRADLDLEPDPAVDALGARLRITPAAPAAPSRPDDKPCVAVLPFVALGNDPDGEWFADGVTEDVIAHLSKMRALSVIARASVARFRDRRHALGEIGRTLGASVVLDGTVRHAGGRVRVVATLIDVVSGRHLWSETYDREPGDIFAIQTDVALHIAAALAGEISRDEQARVRREPTRDVEAYRFFLQGRQWFLRFSADSLARAIELFERAVARDPAFALAHAHIAMASTELAEQGLVAPEAAFARASDAAAAALRADPDLGAAHCTAAYLKTVRDFDWEGAERAYLRALELSPGAAETYDLYGRMCAGLGRHDEAIALVLRAHALDPVAHRFDLATVLLRAGRTDDAIAHAEAAAEFEPGTARAHATLGWAYFLAGRRDAGLAALEHAVSLAPEDSLWLGQLGEAYGLAGDPVRARAVLSQLERRAEHTFVSPYHFAYVYTGLGDAGQAIDWLERAVAARTGGAYGIKGSFLFKPLHEHPRFRTLLREMRVAVD
ncbi:MAG TPA: BTAD domain-containing putative transcriptional regulator [Gemmatimonadaceae bacterium]|jgi:TolB-like protein|nr:BTAD domain-containing putative transcriptional regulator [Gemmatimonadaceae bacterium]